MPVRGGVETYNERSLRSQGVGLQTSKSPQKIQGMLEQISMMLQKNAITGIPLDTPGLYSTLFLFRKASGGWRPVTDLKQLNTHIDAPHFRMRSAEYPRKRRFYMIINEVIHP